MMPLTEKLDELRAGAAQRIPAEHLEVMHRAVDDLRGSGIQDGVIRTGDTVPAFELPDVAGRPVRSAELLQKGPLVVTFYRGLW